jgi:hypothetical protein
MTSGKYSKYLVKHFIEHGDFGPKISITGERDFGKDFSIICLPVTKPVLMEKYPHTHDFDMYLTFIGLDPRGIEELGAEIELGLGEEQEIYKITSPTSVYIPRGMVHCPLDFKKVDKPLLLIHSSLTSKYVKKES